MFGDHRFACHIAESLGVSAEVSRKQSRAYQTRKTGRQRQQLFAERARFPHRRPNKLAAGLKRQNITNEFHGRSVSHLKNRANEKLNRFVRMWVDHKTVLFFK